MALRQALAGKDRVASIGGGIGGGQDRNIRTGTTLRSRLACSRWGFTRVGLGMEMARPSKTRWSLSHQPPWRQWWTRTLGNVEVDWGRVQRWSRCKFVLWHAGRRACHEDKPGVRRRSELRGFH
ncbi:hypothetical protein Salat_1671400 [Sesamum alatum]|uniref:Uncharacterized protein n=1 Tax=Sesamum alatum TaxID=300844 RepID=A0AAE1Y6U4_9LAMI|nr:hypothetical protein Salat_1671400 [Sesamum alatum]